MEQHGGPVLGPAGGAVQGGSEAQPVDGGQQALPARPVGQRHGSLQVPQGGLQAALLLLQGGQLLVQLTAGLQQQAGGGRQVLWSNQGFPLVESGSGLSPVEKQSEVCFFFFSG